MSDLPNSTNFSEALENLGFGKLWISPLAAGFYFQRLASGSFGKRPIDDLLRLGDDFSFALNVPTEIHSSTTDSGT